MMVKFNDQVVNLWEEWALETGDASSDPSEFVDWAVANKKLIPQPQDVKKMLRRQVTQSLRSVRRYDEDGCFTYRAFQSVSLFESGQPIKHYFDTDSGGSPALRHKSVKQRREAIASDVYRAVCDVDRMKSVHADEPQLNFFSDFTDDVIEQRMADQVDLGDADEA